MFSCNPKRLIASSLILALVVATAPAFAAPAPAPTTATLTGTVYAGDVATPLAGATVVVTDVNGVKLASRPTGADGAFAVTRIAAGRSVLALETKDGSFAVATPVTLAPGEARGVHLALKAASDPKEKKKKKGGAGWTGGAIGAMTVVLVGFVAAAVVTDSNMNEDTPASPYQPPVGN
jgi:hypothetical protein